MSEKAVIGDAVQVYSMLLRRGMQGSHQFRHYERLRWRLHSSPVSAWRLGAGWLRSAVQPLSPGPVSGPGSGGRRTSDSGGTAFSFDLLQHAAEAARRPVVEHAVVFRDLDLVIIEIGRDDAVLVALFFAQRQYLAV